MGVEVGDLHFRLLFQRRGVARCSPVGHAQEFSEADCRRQRFLGPLIILNSSQDDPVVTLAPGQALSIEVFEQRDGVLAREPGELLEIRDTQPAVLRLAAR